MPRPHLTTGLTTGLSTGLSSRLRSSLVSLLAVGLVACSDGPATPKAHAPPEDPARTLVDGPSSAEYLAHEVVVRRPTGMSLVELTQIFEELGIQQLDADSLLTRELGYWRLALPADLEADAAIEELSKRGFEAPERNYVMRVDAVPDDPQLSALWGMAKIGAGEAWDHSTGTRTVLVAVTDTGVDRDHPDLVANLWTNPGEIPGNGLDDDGNGYVDDVSGWDTANGDADPEDDHGHGTHVSGTIGAIGNNGVGVAGVSWNVSIIPVKACTGQGSCYTTATAEALLYTAKVKADVINASWGGPGYVSYLHDAVKQVAAAGGLLVAAAGNKSTNNDYTKNYPSSYPEDNVLAVAATDSNDTLAYFSNYGATEVDLAAPGVGILSTVPGGGYAQMSGTSMASPHVAGAAGLLLAHAPAWTYHDLRARLLDYTDRVPGLAGRVVTGGRLNVNRAMVELNECLGENDCDANATCSDTAEGYTCTCKSGFVGDGTTCSDVDECADQTAGCHANATCTNLPGSFSCACKPGFAGNGTMCKDVDECASGLAGCSANATCHNTAGSFSCTCKDGFTGDGYACFDVDECALGQNGCSPNAVCQNVPGSYACACKPGFEGDGFNCGDLDECALGLDACDDHATCANDQGSYSCTCQPGWTGNGLFCDDVDECVDGLAGCHELATCQNLPGSFLCTCGEGYAGNGQTCEDVDECALGQDDCDPAAICDNTVGSFTCTCGPGFKGNGKSCQDVDECALSQDDCHAQAFCTNTPGSFSCACKSGYAGDGKTCSDVDECATGTPCAAPATCQNVPGSYQCNCPAGYTGGGFNCSDVDECALGQHDCDPHATCINEPGGFSCTCAAGYVGDGKSCSDVDECALGQDACAAEATCQNTPGSYTCACPAGYVGDGTSCQDVNECALGQHDCPTHAVCQNTPGGYTCACAAGYTGNGYACSDVDECALGQDQCDPSATCVNTDGSYTCACPSGYQASGTICVDVNECLFGLDDCDPMATCQNTPGGYTCSCPSGWVGDGKICNDVDECGLGLDDCHQKATCQNLPGGFACLCEPGWQGSGKLCTDVDECAVGTHACSQQAHCINSPGGYDCNCKDGYFGNGFFCSQDGDVDECALGMDDCSPDATCFNVTNSYVCLCNPGFSGDGKTCQDVDECTLGTHACDPHASCSNNVGGYDCSCDAGFTGDGKTCLDEDECALGQDDCDPNATCYNLAGGFSCSCNAGYVGDGKTCDADECMLGTHDCAPEATCSDLPGGFSCACGAGYTGDGKTCSDVDECQLGTDDCDPLATCHNTVGGFGCTCPAGYAGDGKTCADVNECQNGQASCGAHADCQNTIGSYTCSCQAGYVGDGQSCSDVDECALATDDCDPVATCTNLPGSFVCNCPANWVGDGRSCAPDECALGTDDCDELALCIDAPSGFTCVCPAGFTGDGTTCADVDECAQQTDDCEHATCVNDPGSYHCDCDPGYLPVGDDCVPEPTMVIEVDAGGDHSCSLSDNGAVRCWGRNNYGQLGYGHTQNLGDDEQIESVGYVELGGQVAQISAGVAHSCALMTDGTVRCWGRNAHGQLGLGHTQAIGDDEPAIAGGVVDLGGSATQVAAGGEHSCALMVGGAVRCWGLGIDGQLGYANVDDVGDDELPSAAGDVPLGGVAVQITAGRDHSCALLDTGAVRCWGRGLWAPLGYGHTSSIGDDETPASAGDVALGGPATQVSAGWYHTCAVLVGGGVKCWGFGYTGQLGYANVNDIGDDELPVSAGDVQVGGAVTAIATGLYHTCALLSGGAVRCWGYGESGRLGYGDTVSIGDDEHPASAGDVPLGGVATSITLGTEHSCARLSGGVVKCWGDGSYGQLGGGTTLDLGDDETPEVTAPLLLSEIDECQLESDDCDAMATCQNLTIGYACSCNPGYAGTGTTCDDVDECADETHDCDVNAACSNTVGGFGCSCLAGFTGDGHTCDLLGDVPVAIAAGDDHNCSLHASGEVRCWGLGAYGQLGYAATANVGDDEAPYTAGPVALGGTAVALGLGGQHSCAVLDTGAVRCWGRGTDGRLGHGNEQHVGNDETPASVGDVAVGGSATAVVAGQAHSCALLVGGVVRCWGYGGQGRLGYGNTQDIGDDELPSSAGDVPLGAPAVALAAGDLHTCALLQGGGVRCWGDGLYGQLGQASTVAIGDDETPQSVPEVSLGGSAVAIAAGRFHSCAILSGGAVRCWGLGAYGVLGTGQTLNVGDDETPASVAPVALGGAATAIAAGAYHSCAIDDLGVHCWGFGGDGRLGYGDTLNIGDDETPGSMGPVNLAPGVVEVTAGAAHSCALFDSGTVQCWGKAGFGQLGYGNLLVIGDDETPAAAGWVELLEP